MNGNLSKEKSDKLAQIKSLGLSRNLTELAISVLNGQTPRSRLFDLLREGYETQDGATARVRDYGEALRGTKKLHDDKELCTRMVEASDATENIRNLEKLVRII